MINFQAIIYSVPFILLTLTYQMLVDKQTCFENHHYQKIFSCNVFIIIRNFLFNTSNFCVVVSFLVTNSLTSINFFNQFIIYIVFLTTLLFTTLLSSLKSTVVSNLSTSDFKMTKSISLANFDVSMPVALLKSDFIA